MADAYERRLQELLDEFRKDLAEIVSRAEAAVRDEIERIRKERLDELRNEIATKS